MAVRCLYLDTAHRPAEVLIASNCCKAKSALLVCLSDIILYEELPYVSVLFDGVCCTIGIARFKAYNSSRSFREKTGLCASLSAVKFVES